MYNPETMSEREIRLHQMRIDQSYSKRLTRASCLLQRMHNGDLDAFAEARKEFTWLNEKMSYKEIYNRLWGWVKYGWSPKRTVNIQSDEYASESEWMQFFAWRHLQK